MLAACGGSSGGTNQSSDGIAVDGELNVGVRVGSIPNAAVEALIATQGSILIADDATSFYRVSLKPGVSYEKAAAALVHPDIVVVEPNYLAWGYAAPSDPYYATSQYSAKLQAELELAWEAHAAVTSAHSQVVIAVLDTGVRASHEDLVNKVDTSHAKDYVNLAGTAAADDNGHGTYVAGIAAAEVNNAAGIAGVASWTGSGADPALVKVMPVKVSDARNVSNHAAIAAGMSWAVAHGANIILVSLGSATPSWTLQKAVQDAHAAGVLVVAAAGNDGVASARYPAAYQGTNQGVLSVSSVNAADAIDGSHKTNYGSWVNVLAPGAGVSSTGNASDTDYVTSLVGSSYAAAHVAGVAALVWSTYVPTTVHGAGLLTADEVRNAVLAGLDSYDRGTSNTINAAGGRVNPQKAMAAAASIQSHAAGSILPGSVVFNGTSLRGGATAVGTVVLTDPAPASTVIALHSSDSHLVVPTAGVTVLKGYRYATFTVTTTPVSATTPVTVTATANNGVVGSGSIDLTSPGVSRVALAPSTVVGGANVTGTVTLAGPAPVGGVPVTLSDDSAYVSFAGSTVVSVPANQTTATFTINTTAVSSVQTVHVTATAGSTSATATLTVKPLLASVSFTPSAVKGGAAASLRVVLNGAASFDVDVAVSILDPGNALTPESIVTSARVTSGTNSKTIPIATRPVVGPATVIASARYGGFSTADARLTVNAPSVSSLTATSGSLIWWDATHVTTGAATVTLDAIVASTTTVYVSSTDMALEVPSSVTIPPGGKTATFFVKPAAVVGQISAAVWASLTSDFAVKKTATFTLKPALANMTLASSQVAGGATVRGTVTLSAAAPVNFDVALVSTSARVTMDPSLTVTAGLTTANFFVVTSASSAAESLTVSASANGVTKNATLKLTAPTLSSLALSPSTANVGDTVTGTITLSGNALGRTPVAITATDTTAVPVSGFSPVYIATGSSTGTFTFTAGSVTAQKTVTVTATLNGSPKTASLIVRPAAVAVSLSAGTVVGGGTVTGTVTLPSAAPAGGTVVTLAGVDPATVSSTALRVPAGLMTAGFNVTTVAVDADTVTTISATVGTYTTRTNLTVTAPTFLDVTNLVTVDSTDTTKTVVVRITSPAGPAGVAITVGASSDSTVASVTAPNPSKILATATSADITVTRGSGTGSATFTVTIFGTPHTVNITSQ